MSEPMKVGKNVNANRAILSMMGVHPKDHRSILDDTLLFESPPKKFHIRFPDQYKPGGFPNKKFRVRKKPQYRIPKRQAWKLRNNK